MEYKTYLKWIYLQNRNRLTDVEDRLAVWQGGVGEGWIESLGLVDQIIVYRTDKQQDPTV